MRDRRDDRAFDVELVADNGFIGVVGNMLFIDLDGGAITGSGDDILVSTFSDGGGGFNILTDVLV